MPLHTNSFHTKKIKKTYHNIYFYKVFTYRYNKDLRAINKLKLNESKNIKGPKLMVSSNMSGQNHQ